MFKRFLSLILVILHLAVFGPIREVFAYSGQSANYRLNSGTLAEGGKARATATYNLSQDTVGEPCIGRAQSANYNLEFRGIPGTHYLIHGE